MHAGHAPRVPVERRALAVLDAVIGRDFHDIAALHRAYRAHRVDLAARLAVRIRTHAHFALGAVGPQRLGGARKKIDRGRRAEREVVGMQREPAARRSGETDQQVELVARVGRRHERQVEERELLGKGKVFDEEPGRR